MQCDDEDEVLRIFGKVGQESTRYEAGLQIKSPAANTSMKLTMQRQLPAVRGDRC